MQGVELADYGRWKLPQNLADLSEGDSYPGVLREWKLDHIEHLAPGEDLKTCLCTHSPIREVCHIINRRNHNTALVGNCCVQKFEKEEAGVANFVGTHKVFDSLKRLQKDEKARANKELLTYAYSKGVLTEQEYSSYWQIWKNRSFTPGENRLILTANRKIINHASSAEMRDLIAKQVAEKQRKPVVQIQARNTVPNPVVPIMTYVMQRPSFHGPSSQTIVPGINRVATVAPPNPIREQQSSDSVFTPLAPKKKTDQLLAELRAQPDRVADVQIVREAYSQRILMKNQFEIYMEMVESAGKSPMSTSQQPWLSGLNQKILSQFKLNEPMPSRAHEGATPGQVKLADRQIVVDAHNKGLIKDKDRDFYFGLIQRRVVNLSERQLNWVKDIHKRLRIEDEQTEANSNPRPVKRALTMETDFVDEARK